MAFPQLLRRRACLMQEIERSETIIKVLQQYNQEDELLLCASRSRAFTLMAEVSLAERNAAIADLQDRICSLHGDILQMDFAVFSAM